MFRELRVTMRGSPACDPSLSKSRNSLSVHWSDGNSCLVFFLQGPSKPAVSRNGNRDRRTTNSFSVGDLSAHRHGGDQGDGSQDVEELAVVDLLRVRVEVQLRQQLFEARLGQ
jgi:hypothetical protein